MDPFNNLYILHSNIPENQPDYFLINTELYNPSFQIFDPSFQIFDPSFQMYSPSLQESEYGELQYILQRNKEELLHKNWIRQRRDLETKVQEKMENNMKVRSGDNRVKFIYKCKGHETLGAMIFRFKITLVYHNLLRKWYISPGYSFVPEVINFKGKLKYGTYNPFSQEVLDIIHNVKRLIDAFMKRLTIVYQFVHDAQKRYKDMQFVMNAIVTKMKLIFTENAWPSDLQKSNIKDMIIVELKLNKNIEVNNIAYKYIQEAGTENTKTLNKLQSKLQNFFYFPLEEAFEIFITGEERSISSQEQEM